MLRIAVRSDSEVRHFQMPSAEALLGASPEADLHSPFPGISQRHAVLRPTGRGLLIADAGSKNGLVRDGERIPEIHLHPGDSVTLGRAVLTLEEISTGDGALALDLAISRTPSEDRPRSDTPITDTFAEPTTGVSAARAILWIRNHARSGPIRLDDHRTFDSARRALGARALLVARRDSGDEGPTIDAVSGETPDDPVLAALLAAAGPTDQPMDVAVPVHSNGAPALVGSIGPPAAGQLLLAVLGPGQRRVTDWQLDFFEFLRHQLIADVAFEPAGVEPAKPRSAPALRFPDGFVRGTSSAMESLFEQIRATVTSNLDVLLLGETGTGKELVAQAIHASGPTAKGPFVPINCAAIPGELLEAQLFGVERRIATGVDPREGLFLRAHGGSIFLDEIGELPLTLQAKLLRVLQEREVLAVGGHTTKKVTLRVISASNRDLERAVADGQFRADLFYRLRGLRFHLPPLRDRKEDIPELVSAFVREAVRESGRRTPGVTRKALALLSDYDWPGNVRELRNEVLRAVLVAKPGEALGSEHFGGVRWRLEQGTADETQVAAGTPTPAPSDSSRNLGDALLSAAELDRLEDLTLGDARDELERRLIIEALRRSGGVQTRAASLLGITRNGLALKIRRLGISDT